MKKPSFLETTTLERPAEPGRVLDRWPPVDLNEEFLGAVAIERPVESYRFWEAR